MVRDGEGQAKGGITGFSGVPLHAVPPLPGVALSGQGRGEVRGGRVIAAYLERCRAYAAAPPGEEWDGVWERRAERTQADARALG